MSMVLFKENEITVLPFELSALVWSSLGIKDSLSDPSIGLFLGFIYSLYFPDTRPAYWRHMLLPVKFQCTQLMIAFLWETDGKDN